MRQTRSAWVHVGLFSAVVNVLMLTGSLYMMQVYDRVLASRSVATLVGVSLIALAAYMLQGWLDHIRLKMLGRIGCTVDAALSPLTLRAAMSAPLRGADPVDAMTPFRDLAALRGFLASLGPTAFLDMPFAPLFLAVCFLLHPWLGWLAIGGMATIVLLTVLAERLSAAPGAASSQSNAEQTALLETGRRNAEAISALGMRGTFAARFDQVHQRHVEHMMQVSERSGGLGSFAKMFRFVLQSAVLGLGGYLVIRGELSGGAMIAASIVVARALAPVELAVSHMKSFTSARQGYRRLHEALPNLEPRPLSLALPAPTRSLRVEDIALAPPGSRHAIVNGVSFALEAGDALGLIGPSGSGKSSIARALVGIWAPARGVIRLDGAALSQWDADALGRAIGYLPQDVELFPGTIAENIARFDPEASSEKILAATRQAGAHDMIVGFRDGYETKVGEGGAALSGGQRQRIALARALYGDPFLLVLDEPNSSLDAEGDEALTQAIVGVKARGGVVVVITHRPSGLASVDHVGVVAGGQLQDYGPADEILRRVRPSAASPARQAEPAEGAAERPGHGREPRFPHAVDAGAPSRAASFGPSPVTAVSAAALRAESSGSAGRILRRIADTMRAADAPGAGRGEDAPRASFGRKGERA